MPTRLARCDGRQPLPMDSSILPAPPARVARVLHSRCLAHFGVSDRKHVMRGISRLQCLQLINPRHRRCARARPRVRHAVHLRGVQVLVLRPHRAQQQAVDGYQVDVVTQITPTSYGSKKSSSRHATSLSRLRPPRNR